MSSPTSDYESTSSCGGGGGSPQKQHSPNASDAPARAKTPMQSRNSTITLCSASSLDKRASNTFEAPLQAQTEGAASGGADANAERERYEQLLKALEHWMQRVGPESDSESGTCTPNSLGFCQSFSVGAPALAGQSPAPPDLLLTTIPKSAYNTATAATSPPSRDQHEQQQQSPESKGQCSSVRSSKKSHRSRTTCEVDGSTLPECVRSQPHARFFQAGVRALVLFDFSAISAGELTVRAGEIVELVAHETRSAWVCVRARAQSSACGYVPASYLAPVECVVRPEPLLDLLDGAVAGTGAGTVAAAAGAGARANARANARPAIPEPPPYLPDERHSVARADSVRSHRTTSTNVSASGSHASSSSTSDEKLRHVSGSTINSGSSHQSTTVPPAIGNQNTGSEDNDTLCFKNSGAHFVPIQPNAIHSHETLEADVSRSALCSPRMQRRATSAVNDTKQSSPSLQPDPAVHSSTLTVATAPVPQSKSSRPAVTAHYSRAAKEKRRSGGGLSLWEQLEERWKRQSSPSRDDSERETGPINKHRETKTEKDWEYVRSGSDPKQQIVHSMARGTKASGAAANAKTIVSASRTSTPQHTLSSEMELVSRERSYTVTGAINERTAETRTSSRGQNTNTNSNSRIPQPNLRLSGREEKMAAHSAGLQLLKPPSGASAAQRRSQPEIFSAHQIIPASQSLSVYPQHVELKKTGTIPTRIQQQPSTPQPVVLETDLDTGLSATLVFNTLTGSARAQTAVLGSNSAPLKEAYV